VKQTFGIVAIVATVNGVLIQMIMASRALYGLGQRGHLPAFLAIVSPPNAHAYCCYAFGGTDNWRLGDNNAD
jgi:amino acid transporter